MFDREALSARCVTDAARRMLGQIVPRAIDRGLVLDASTLLPIVLWALLKWEKKVGLVVLQELGLTEKLASNLDAHLQTLAADHDRQNKLSMTHRIVQDDAPEASEQFLDRATEEARQLEHGWVGTEHLLLAIVSGADSEFSTVLSDCGVTHGALKATVQGILGETEVEFFRTGDRVPSSGLYRFQTHTEPKRCFPSRPYQVDLAQGDRFPACGACEGACRWQLVVPT